MKRRFPLFLIVGVVLLALAVGVYTFRRRASMTGTVSEPSARTSMPGMPGMPDMPSGGTPDKASEPPSTPRGEVTIVRAVQQLIGGPTVLQRGAPIKVQAVTASSATTKRSRPT